MPATYHEVSQTVKSLDGKWRGRSSSGYDKGHDLQFCLNFNSSIGFGGLLSAFTNLVSVQVDRPFRVPPSRGSMEGPRPMPTLANLAIFSHAPKLRRLRIDDAGQLRTFAFTSIETDDEEAPYVDYDTLLTHTNPQLEELRIGNARRLLSLRGLPPVCPRLSLEVRGARYPLDFGVLGGLTAMTKLALGPYTAGDVRTAQLNPRGRLDDGLYHSGTDFRYNLESSFAPSSFADVLAMLPSLEWLELPCYSSITSMVELTRLSGLHTLLLPFHIITDVSGLSSCIHLTRLDLGMSPRWYDNDNIRADLEKVFRREGAPIRHIRFRKTWADLVDLANLMSLATPREAHFEGRMQLLHLRG